MTRPALSGIHHLKIPVTDLARSLAWYERVFGFETVIEFKGDDGVRHGVGGEVPGLDGTKFALRQSPELAAAFTGFDPIAFAVDTRADLEAWAAYLDGIGVPHSPLIRGKLGWVVGIDDPDGLQLVLYSRAGLDADDSH